ncbi:hypothetical protein ABGB12_18085 [Actinocorallia sp. B10E7]|uniref:hypothetical protein n=1 Tax=Actinocorallia sp. B10E7 TaxID=3153558 RepID=UPI00325F5496
MSPDQVSFPNIFALGTYGPKASDELTRLRSELLAIGAHNDAERLTALDTAAEQRDFPLLQRLVGTGIPLSEAEDVLQIPVRRMVGLRNVVAILPLILTWFMLAWGSWAYYRQVHQNPQLITEPFLVLWQSRFDTFIPTFAETSIGSFLLLSVVLTLTLLGHRRESDANRALARLHSLADDAVSTLSLAIENSDIRPPEDAKEWAEAAQRVLTETQTLIKTAVADTQRLADNNARIAKEAADTLERLQEHAENLLVGIAREASEVIKALELQGERTTTRVGSEAVALLQQTADANRQVVEQQMVPLFDGFKASLTEYRKDQAVYSASAASLAGGVKDLTTAASGLSAGVAAYSGIGEDIDAKLQLIETAQTKLSAEVAVHAKALTTASAGVLEVVKLASGPMRADLEALTRSAADVGGGVEAALRQLGPTTTALHTVSADVSVAARELKAAAVELGRVTGSSSGFLARLFGRR